MGECVLTRRSIVKNEYQKLADIIVSGSAVTQVDISGLNIGKGEEIVLVSSIINNNSGCEYWLYANANYTNTNYYNQMLLADTTSVSADRPNSPRYVAYIGSGQFSFSISKIKLTNNGYFVVQSNVNRMFGSSSVNLDDHYLSSTFTMTSITSLRIASQNASQIGIGSRFQLYKVGG